MRDVLEERVASQAWPFDSAVLAASAAAVCKSHSEESARRSGRFCLIRERLLLVDEPGPAGGWSAVVDLACGNAEMEEEEEESLVSSEPRIW